MSSQLTARVSVSRCARAVTHLVANCTRDANAPSLVAIGWGRECSAHCVVAILCVLVRACACVQVCLGAFMNLLVLILWVSVC